MKAVEKFSCQSVIDQPHLISFLYSKRKSCRRQSLCFRGL